jgi:catechol 2,3-dioxygenase-like lactoylglutathione lyase family enzyme
VRKDKSMVKGITFIGIRTSAIREMTHLCTDVFGLKPRHQDRDFVALEAPNGDRVELFAPDHPKHTHFTTGPVAGFEVDDVLLARQALVDARLEILSEVEGTEGGTQWVHFRGPDGNVYEIVKHSGVTT